MTFLKTLKNVKFVVAFSLLIWSNSAFCGDRPKIGLVLSGGGAKGIAHIGTLKLIDSLNIPIDYIVGTSMGGIIGGLYAIGYSAEKIEKLMIETDWNEILSDQPERKYLPHFLKKNTGKFQLEFGLNGFTPVIPEAIISGQKVSLLLSKLTASFENITDFDSLPIAFRCLTIDLISDKEVVLSKGSISKAMRATMSVPTVFSPVEWDDLLLVDGGVLNNFPVDVVRKMGANFVIGVNVSSGMKKKAKLNNIFDILEQTINIPGIDSEKEHEAQTDILIKPHIGDYTAGDFDRQKIDELLRFGEEAAHENLSKLINLKLKLEKSFQSVKKNIPVKSMPSQEQIDNKTLIIHAVSIEGNETIPFDFIFNLLGIKPGDKFDPDLLYQNISEMYGLGYFETINYEIEPINNSYIKITLKVKEKSLRKMQVGLRYDDEYKLVGIIGVQTTNFLFPGLRTQSELQFAGLTKFKLNAAYPTRTLDFPIYPYLSINYKNVPINIFDNHGEKVASYADNSFSTGIGIGLSFNKFWVLESELNLEYMNISPDIADRSQPDLLRNWKDKLRKLQISLDFDLLDDALFPRTGTLIQANLEKSSIDLGSDVDYLKMSFSADIYNTFFKLHTLRLFGYYCKSSDNLPVYKAFMLGGPESFIGLDYNQLLGNQMAILRSDYRYEYKKDIFLKLILNIAFDYKLGSLKIPSENGIIWGYGVGVEFLSIFGPLQLIISHGDKSYLLPGDKRSLIYFTAGYKF